MLRSTDRVLTTHVGSLPRPADVAELIHARQQEGTVDEEQFQKRVTEATAEVVARQKDIGVDIVSDGEVGKNSYIDYVVERLTGFGGALNPAEEFYFHDLLPVPELAIETFKGTRLVMPVCEGEISYVGEAAVARDIANFTQALGSNHPTGAAFMPAASPGVIAKFLPNRHYKDFESYIFAIADAMSVEYRAINSAGIVVQLDAPDLGYGADFQYWLSDVVEEKGLRWSQDVQVEAINRALDGIPAENVRLHLCWSNYMGPHVNDQPLVEVLEPTVKANVAAISFEGANPAHAHEWEIFKDFKLPDDKIILPGVVDTKTQVVEHPRLVAQRIQQYANLVGKERVIASSDCGFGTFVGIGTVHHEVSWMKLKSLTEGAEMASAELG